MAYRIALLFVVLAACNDATDDEEASFEVQCTDPVVVECQTEMADQLPVHDAVSAGAIVSTIDGNDWVVDVDATAGGFVDAPDNPWLYVRFTDEGAEKLDITDVDAFDSMDWHMAFHRFRIRLNGGSSGPSCVAAAAFPDASYADLTIDDANDAAFETDAFFDDECAFQSDIDNPEAPEGIPITAMQDWWTYPDCVATTGVPFLVRLDTGRHLRIEILRYYGTGQETCNADGVMGSESGLIQLTWAFVH